MTNQHQVDRSGDAADYCFLTAPRASVECRLVSLPDGLDLQIFGNRAGLLSLANILLWFVDNAWRREFLSFGDLGFVRFDGSLAVSVRISDDVPTQSHGTISRLDRGEALEWAVSEEGLRQVALWMHRIVCSSAHEYDRLLVADGSVCRVEIRMTDCAEWLNRGTA